MSTACTITTEGYLHGVTLDSKDKYLYISDASGPLIYRVTNPFDYSNALQQPIGGNGDYVPYIDGVATEVGLDFPWGVRYNNNTHELLFADNQRIRKVTAIDISTDSNDDDDDDENSLAWYLWLVIAISITVFVFASVFLFNMFSRKTSLLESPDPTTSL